MSTTHPDLTSNYQEVVDKPSKKKICLFVDMVLETNLSYSQAEEAMKLAIATDVMKDYTFYITGQHCQSGYYALMARNIKLSKDFRAYPEKYVVEISNNM